MSMVSLQLAPAAPEEASQRQQLLDPVIAAAFPQRPDFARLSALSPEFTDYLLLTHHDEPKPLDVFSKLRWGGQCLFASPRRRQAVTLARELSQIGFTIEIEPSFVTLPRLGWTKFLPDRRTHYFLARKTRLILPDHWTDRFTYDIQLVRDPASEGYVVLKQIPSLQFLLKRLHERFPDASSEMLEKRARKFTDRIFPTFLTREANTLQVLQRDLPKPYNRRVPEVLRLEKDSNGFVQKIWMNWLRNGRTPITQLEFARQSADLLSIIHDHVGVIHLDLRLDNMVITDYGVGFIDFGSAVRVGEKLTDNPLLDSLFSELMRTSQIQRMLEKMTLSGQVTSHAIHNGYKKVDKAVDFFFLAVQISEPHSNPDLRHLIRFNPNSDEAKALARLTQTILKPPHPSQPPFRSAIDILRGVLAIRDQLYGRRIGA